MPDNGPVRVNGGFLDGEADKEFMKILLNLLLSRLFPSWHKPIRIDPDNLPGLIPPKTPPMHPVRPKPIEPQAPDYQSLYMKFKKTRSTTRRQPNTKRGWDS